MIHLQVKSDRLKICTVLTRALAQCQFMKFVYIFSKISLEAQHPTIGRPSCKKPSCVYVSRCVGVCEVKMATKTFKCVLLPPWDRVEGTFTGMLDLARWTAELGGETIDQYNKSTLGALSMWMFRAKSGDYVYLTETLEMTDSSERADFGLECA